jgi:SAM-dependent methyltransferase
MAQRNSGLHAVLSLSWAYNAFQHAVGAERYRRRVVEEIIRPTAGQRILDIGCGTGEVLRYLPPVEYLGVDLSPHYIQSARDRFGDRGDFFVGRADDLKLPPDRRFELAMAFGLLHHLEDAEVERLFDAVRGLLAPGGRLVTVDCTLIEGQHPLARFVIKRDRGLNVRTIDEILRLAGRHFQTPTASVHTDLLRIPYTHVVLDCRV